MLSGLQEFLSSPQAKGLAAGLLQSSGYSTMPVSFGQALGQGLLTGQQFADRAARQQLEEKGLALQERLGQGRLDLMRQQQAAARQALAANQQAAAAQAAAQQELQARAAGILASPELSDEQKRQQLGGLLAATGDIKGAVGLLPKAIEPKPLSAEKAKLTTLSRSAMDDVATLKNMLAEGKIGAKELLLSETGTGPLGLISRKFSPAAQKFNALRLNLADAFGRLRSGGAINKEEERRFLALLPQAGDNKATIDFKINNIEKTFKDLTENLSENGAQAITPSQQDMTNQTLQAAEALLNKFGTPTGKNQPRILTYNPATGRLE